jgi:Arc/MetJ-type ribon-helix-helix transcriptional regulator
MDGDRSRCNAHGYAERMAQLVTRVDDELAAAVDALVVSGVVASRSEAVRVGLLDLVERHRRAEIGRRIVVGYESMPQTDAEVGWADEATERMIADEPW